MKSCFSIKKFEFDQGKECGVPVYWSKYTTGVKHLVNGSRKKILGRFLQTWEKVQTPRLFGICKTFFLSFVIVNIYYS